MRWSPRTEKKLVSSEMGKTRDNWLSARKPMGLPLASTVVKPGRTPLLAAVGTGVPESRKRGPTKAPVAMGLNAGQRLPTFGLGSGFVPFNPVEPPLDTK